MREPRNFAIVLLMLLGAAAVVLWAREHARVVALETERPAHTAEVGRLQEAVQHAEAQAAKLETELKNLHDAERQANREAKRRQRQEEQRQERATELAAAGANALTGAPDQWTASANDPEVMRREEEAARLKIVERFAPLFDRLGLAPEMRDRLTALLTEKKQAPLDVAASEFHNGSDPRTDPETYADLVAATRADVEDRIHELLGDAGYQAYKDFNQSAGQTQVLNQLDALLRDRNQPLSAEQSAQLQQAMQAAGAGHVSAKLVAQAKTFLTPAQLQALSDLRALQQANSRRRNQPVQTLPTTPGGG